MNPIRNVKAFKCEFGAIIRSNGLDSLLKIEFVCKK